MSGHEGWEISCRKLFSSIGGFLGAPCTPSKLLLHCHSSGITIYFLVPTRTHTQTQKCKPTLIWGSQNYCQCDILIPAGPISEFQMFLAKIFCCWRQWSKAVKSVDSGDSLPASEFHPIPQHPGGLGQLMPKPQLPHIWNEETNRACLPALLWG